MYSNVFNVAIGSSHLDQVACEFLFRGEALVAGLEPRSAAVVSDVGMGQRFGRFFCCLQTGTRGHAEREAVWRAAGSDQGLV